MSPADSTAPLQTYQDVKSPSKLELSTHKRPQRHGPELMLSRQQFRHNKTKTANISQLCLRVEGQLEEELALLRRNQVLNDIKQREFTQLSEILGDLEETQPSAFPMLLSYTVKEANQAMEYSHKVASEHVSEQRFPAK